MSLDSTGVAYDRRALGVGIVHFGVGNFHRSHEAMYLDRLARLGLADGWGISGIGVLESDGRMRDALRSQGLTYTLVEQDPAGGRRVSTIGSIVEYLYAPDELDAVLERLADPATRIVSLTITEGGYNISDSTGRFDPDSPHIQADLQPGASPRSVFGIIVAGLQRRRSRGIAPFTIMSCDNIEENGRIARTSFAGFAELLDPELGAWVRDHVSFPSSMVDRITPVTTDEHRELVRHEYGIDDAWPVVSESFEQWVLEDRFPLGRPPFERVGVQVVDDVRPYELMKLRLLNGSHQALAYFGLLRGIELVHDAAEDQGVADAVERYMREAVRTLDPVPGIDLDDYERTLLARFRNPHVRDTLARLATDGSDRIPKFVVPVVRRRRALGLASPDTVAVLAAWAHYLERARAARSALPFSDRQSGEIDAALARLEVEPADFLRNDAWFGDLADDAIIAEEFTAAYRAIRAEGVSR